MAADIDINLLLDSWTLDLRAQRKSGETIKSYRQGVLTYQRWLEGVGEPEAITATLVRRFIVSLLEAGAEATTARARLLGVRRFSAWLAEEGEIDSDELTDVKAPKLDAKVVERLTDEQCAALVKACEGKAFRDVRDMAIVRFMLEAIVRAGEVVGMDVEDLKVLTQTATVRGKGRRDRVVHISPQTARAMDRYLRARRKHRLAAETTKLWLGDRGRTLSYNGLYRALLHRAELAGIEGFHPHLTRHTAAQRWLAAGGTEGGLMTIGGWSSRDMLDRYTRASNADRAIQEARRLNLGDL